MGYDVTSIFGVDDDGKGKDFSPMDKELVTLCDGGGDNDGGYGGDGVIAI